MFTNFPPDDLIDDLVDLYFRNINDFTPLLHERMFKNAISRGLHFHNGGFGATVLLVCANAARYSSDPRCISDEYSGDKWSGGWNWFKEVEESRKTIFTPAQLYDLQIYVVCVVVFSAGASLTIDTLLAYDLVPSRNQLSTIVVHFSRNRYPCGH